MACLIVSFHYGDSSVACMLTDRWTWLAHWPQDEQPARFLLYSVYDKRARRLAVFTTTAPHQWHTGNICRSLVRWLCNCKWYSPCGVRWMGFCNLNCCAPSLPLCYNQHIYFDGCFPGEPGSASSSSILFLRLFQKGTFVDHWQRCFMGWMSIWRPNLVKALNHTGST